MTAQINDVPQPPAPPPPPVEDAKVLKERLRQDSRKLREARIRTAKEGIGKVHRRYYGYAGLIVAVSLGAVACNSYRSDKKAEQQYQRDTALALAQLAAGNRTTSEAADPPPTQGIPNPLQALPLSNQAKWNIGAGGDGLLPPKRSTTVITALLERVDLCNVWVGLNDKANVVVAFEPAPGFTPLLEAGQCADTQGQTVVPVPSDPVPTSSTVAQ